MHCVHAMRPNNYISPNPNNSNFNRCRCPRWQFSGEGQIFGRGCTGQMYREKCPAFSAPWVVCCSRERDPSVASRRRGINHGPAGRPGSTRVRSRVHGRSTGSVSSAADNRCDNLISARAEEDPARPGRERRLLLKTRRLAESQLLRARGDTTG